MLAKLLIVLITGDGNGNGNGIQEVNWQSCPLVYYKAISMLVFHSEDV